jgi:uridylate kinase
MRLAFKMQLERKRILLKLSGEMLVGSATRPLDKTLSLSLIEQMNQLKKDYQWGIVIGGGNFLRGSKDSAALGIEQTTGDAVGILATMINGLIMQDFLVKSGLKTSLFGALNGFGWSKAITPQTLQESLAYDDCLIFTGGVGTPFFTTDTTAVVRALQMKADQIWKLTKVEGIFSADPSRDKSAQLLKQVSYDTALQDKLYVIDPTALTLAQQHALVIRVFSMYETHALIRASHDHNFGSTLINR